MRRSLATPLIAWCLLSGLVLLVEPAGQQQAPPPRQIATVTLADVRVQRQLSDGVR